MATETQRVRLRSDIGATVASLPDDDADDIFTEAGEKYTDADSITAYTRVLAIRRLMANAAKLTDYTQNESQEKQSQVFPSLSSFGILVRGTGYGRCSSVNRWRGSFRRYAPQAKRVRGIQVGVDFSLWLSDTAAIPASGRAAAAWARINDKPTSVTFRKPDGTDLSAQTVGLNMTAV